MDKLLSRGIDLNDIHKPFPADGFAFDEYSRGTKSDTSNRNIWKKSCSNRQYFYVSAVIKASTVLHLHMRLVFRRQIAIKLELAGEQFKQHLW